MNNLVYTVLAIEIILGCKVLCWSSIINVQGVTDQTKLIPLALKVEPPTPVNPIAGSSEYRPHSMSGSQHLLLAKTIATQRHVVDLQISESNVVD